MCGIENCHWYFFPSFLSFATWRREKKQQQQRYKRMGTNWGQTIKTTHTHTRRTRETAKKKKKIRALFLYLFDTKGHRIPSTIFMVARFIFLSLCCCCCCIFFFFLRWEHANWLKIHTEIFKLLLMAFCISISVSLYSLSILCNVFFCRSMTKSPYCSSISLDIFKMILCSNDHNNNKPSKQRLRRQRPQCFCKSRFRPFCLCLSRCVCVFFLFIIIYSPLS